MGVQLNIKNPEARALAVKIAKARGVSLTAAVQDALRAALDEIEREDRRERGHAMIRKARDEWTDEERAVDHGLLLYDEDGLPR